MVLLVIRLQTEFRMSAAAKNKIEDCSSGRDVTGETL
jgi:hypothetical protein